MTTHEEIELERWEPTAHDARAFYAIAIVAFLPLASAFAGLGALAHGVDVGTVRIDLSSLIVLLAAFIAALLIHEGIHGLCVFAVGGRPAFGAGIRHGVPYAYTTANGTFPRDQFLVVALAPLVLLTLAGVALLLFTPLYPSLLAVLLALNIIGALGDVALSAIALRYPRSVRIRDERYGITVLGRPEDARPRAGQRSDAAGHAVAREFVHAAPLAIIAAFVVQMALVIGLRTAGVGTLVIPGLLVIEHDPVPRFEVNFTGALALGLLVAAVVAVISARRRGISSSKQARAR